MEHSGDAWKTPGWVTTIPPIITSAAVPDGNTVRYASAGQLLRERKKKFVRYLLFCDADELHHLDRSAENRYGEHHQVGDEHKSGSCGCSSGNVYARR